MNNELKLNYHLLLIDKRTNEVVNLGHNKNLVRIKVEASQISDMFIQKGERDYYDLLILAHGLLKL